MDFVTASAIAELTRRIEELERRLDAKEGRERSGPRAALRLVRPGAPPPAPAPVAAPLVPAKAAKKTAKVSTKTPPKTAKGATKAPQERRIDQVLLESWSPPEHAFIPPRAEDEMRLCIRAIHKARGNKLQAAKIVGLPRRTFYRRFDEYGLYQFNWRTDPPTRLPSEE